MREIKFRAWDKDRKVMANVSNIDFLTGQVQMNAGGMHSERVSGDKVILLQYTGLKDKYDIEIYEGDLLKAPDGYIGLIEYHPTRAQFVGRNAGMDFVDTEFDTLYTNYGKLNFSEVIGNIYENPEVLEGEAE